MSDLDMITTSLSRRSLMGGIGIGGLLSALPTAALAKSLKYTAPTFSGLTKIVNGYVSQKKVAGMVAEVGFHQSEPTVIAAGTHALGGSRLVDRNTIWRLYSQTKPITGMAAMMLIEDGKLRLDQPIAEILPEFANMRVLKNPQGAIGDTVPAERPITIRNLLTHTAGFGYSIISQGPILKAYLAAGINPGQISRLPIPGLDAGAKVPDMETFSKKLAALPLVYQPGSKWSYSVALDLMGYIIQKASGTSFENFLQTRLFDPLQMKDTFWRLPADRVKDFTDNYIVFNGMVLPIDPAAASIYLDKPAFAFGGAGLIGSSADYDKFLKMLLGFGATGGVRVMKTETARLGMANLLPEGANIKDSWIDGNGFGAGGRVGIGTATSPAGTYGWGGAAGTAAFVDTVRGVRAGGYTQYMPANAYAFQSDFAKYVYADLLGDAAPNITGKTS